MDTINHESLKTKKSLNTNTCGRLAQFGRAPTKQTERIPYLTAGRRGRVEDAVIGGRWFESNTVHHECSLTEMNNEALEHAYNPIRERLMGKTTTSYRKQEKINMN